MILIVSNLEPRESLHETACRDGVFYELQWSLNQVVLTLLNILFFHSTSFIVLDSFIFSQLF